MIRLPQRPGLSDLDTLPDQGSRTPSISPLSQRLDLRDLNTLIRQTPPIMELSRRLKPMGSTRRPGTISSDVTMTVLSSQPSINSESENGDEKFVGAHLGPDVIKQIAQFYATLPPKIFTVYDGLLWNYREGAKKTNIMPMPRRHFLTLEQSVFYILQRVGRCPFNSMMGVVDEKLNTYDPSAGWTLWSLGDNLDDENYDTLQCDWTICIEDSRSDIYPELPYRSLCLYGGRLVDLEVYMKLRPLEDHSYIPYMDTVDEVLQLRESYDTRDLRDRVEDARAIINAATSPDPRGDASRSQINS